MSDTIVELSLEEIEAQYPEEWILVDVTELDGGEPLRGIVIDHGSDDRLLSDRMEREWENMKCPYLFFNGPIAPEGTIVIL
jgi:hypothetical protein